MYLKIVIEDQFEGAKFAQEKLKKSAFSACTLLDLDPWKTQFV